ncbi:RNA polymerase sigma factor [Cellulomonas sp. FA1]|uniref:RNA polymerase sigma factor n=1 Tax=Cellulomonas sp. FA1 TaxID=1346710 RepID=UPI00069A206C|nr:RNA polymerase sigma factor [Cellulomonas sp. FA1]
MTLSSAVLGPSEEHDGGDRPAPSEESAPCRQRAGSEELPGDRASEDWISPLFRSMYPELTHYVARHGGASFVADVLSETFLVVWRRRDVAPSGAGERRGWVYGIAKRVLQHHREAVMRDQRLRARLRAISREPPRLAPDPADGVRVRESLERWMKPLTAKERAVVELAVLRDLTAAETASRLGCSTTAVGTRLTRARAKMRRLAQGESV